MIPFIGLNITILNSNNKIVHRIWENHIASYLWKGIFHWSKPLTDKALLAFLKNEGLPRCLCGPIILLSYCNNHITSLNQDNTSQNKQTKTTLRIKKKKKRKKEATYNEPLVRVATHANHCDHRPAPSILHVAGPHVWLTRLVVWKIYCAPTVCF